MKTATVREDVLVTRRGQPVATIVSPRPARRATAKRPDFAARLRATYGDRFVDQDAVDRALADNRCER